MTVDVEARGPVDEEQVAAAEAQLGVRLPEPYRAWLKATGGGHLTTPAELPQVDGEITTFVGFGDDYRLTNQYTGFDDTLPRDYIRIAHGNGGTLVIKVSGEDIGSVWWADHDRADELELTEPSTEHLTRLADEFDDFLTNVS